MTIDGDKIKQLISHYSEDKGYLEKSYVVRFCEDNNLNYKQWNAYCSGTQNLGLKIIEVLMDIFPNLNLNWLLKEELNMFKSYNLVEEPREIYTAEISNQALFNKLESIEKKINKVLENQK
ncbi:hypothetical protein G6N05_05225 [Flavobacterium sp. F372]|uniref:XRE family transcriptional regulator n=1 Tax=Flavobacterium bernardetii TaxID=2813823 RepID=A0ABR7J158_9FLAO|nr:hypothetical protein [Flavobacterium bernardetii]MBC5835781.1 hypothetical protein [Flavobacterium bernardetii]NHF69512.1 hypothetical protein [Flavobacterium bernardetii]